MPVACARAVECLFRQEERGADPGAGRAGRENGCEPAAGCDATRRHDGLVGQLEHDLQERQRADPTCVPARLGALRDDDVDVGRQRRLGPAPALDLRADENARVANARRRTGSDRRTRC